MLAYLAGSATAQMPPPPGLGPAPLLFVRFSGPAGMHATFYQGRPTGYDYAAPVAAGLRPGYLYRVKLSGFTDHPGVSLYPTLEVRGSLALRPGMTAAAYPAPVALTEADMRSALAGSLVTKVVYLEDPDKAVPIAAKPDQVLEADLPVPLDPLAESRELGRPMLIVRLGEREVSPEELVSQNVPGTILLPGEKGMTMPRVGPCLPWGCWPIGTRAEEECLHDGGDRRLRAGIGPDGRLKGLDSEDTVAEYTNGRGCRDVVPSNRICICVPRYGVLRAVLPLGRVEGELIPTDARLVKGQVMVQTKVPSLLTKQYDQLKGYQGRLRPSGAESVGGPGTLLRVHVLEANNIEIGPWIWIYTPAARQLTEVQRTYMKRQIEFAKRLTSLTGLAGTEQVIGTAVVGRIQGHAEVIEGVMETRDLTCLCEKPEVLLPDKPLLLCKWADKHAAQVGDIVTIYLRYSNHGGQPITDVAVSDSLNGRLEYVPDSAQSDRPAVFTTQENEAGSLILRWEVSGRLLPGQSGVVRFQVKVR
jgi:uncharacterized repeat protein (TIGR01451 family)